MRTLVICSKWDFNKKKEVPTIMEGASFCFVTPQVCNQNLLLQ